MTLSSNNPFEDPIVNPNYLSDEYDVSLLIKGKINHLLILSGIELAQQLAESPTYKTKAGTQGMYMPYKEEFIPKNPKQLNEWIVRHFAASVYHPVGTCKMGKEEDEV